MSFRLKEYENIVLNLTRNIIPMMKILIASTADESKYP